jgi:hypothetical protein
MPHRIYVSEDSTYIVMEVEGEITASAQLQRVIESHKLGRELGIKKFLVDVVRARNTQRDLENYRFAHHEIPESPEINKAATIAMVVAPDDHSHDFVEVVSRNSGQNVTLFRDMDDAVRFLKGD